MEDHYSRKMAKKQNFVILIPTKIEMKEIYMVFNYQVLPQMAKNILSV